RHASAVTSTRVPGPQADESTVATAARRGGGDRSLDEDRAADHDTDLAAAVVAIYVDVGGGMDVAPGDGVDESTVAGLRAAPRAHEPVDDDVTIERLEHVEGVGVRHEIDGAP